MDKNEFLAAFINAVVNEDDEASQAHLREYVKARSRDILNSKRSRLVESLALFEDFKRRLFEYMEDSPIQHNGDRILVNGQVVGRLAPVELNYDSEEDMARDGGINFISADGKFSKEFISVEDLYKFLAAQYLGEKQ